MTSSQLTTLLFFRSGLAHLPFSLPPLASSGTTNSASTILHSLAAVRPTSSRPMMTVATPLASPPGPPGPSMQEIATTPQTRDFARYISYTPPGAITPTPSATTDVPLLPTNYPIPPTPPRDTEHRFKLTKLRLFITRLNSCMLGKEVASVYWYASLLSVLAALVVTLSSIFGWPPLPIWEYLRHVTA